MTGIAAADAAIVRVGNVDSMSLEFFLHQLSMLGNITVAIVAADKRRNKMVEISLRASISQTTTGTRYSLSISAFEI